MTTPKPFSFDQCEFEADRLDGSLTLQRPRKAAPVVQSNRYFIAELNDVATDQNIEMSKRASQIERRAFDYENVLARRLAKVPQAQRKQQQFFTDNQIEYDIKRKVYSLGFSMTKNLDFQRVEDQPHTFKRTSRDWIYQESNYDQKAKDAKRRREQLMVRDANRAGGPII